MGSIAIGDERRYALGAVLGRGGMGVVHAAHDRARGCEVALKRLNLDVSTSAQQRAHATALFEREYHTLSLLTHPRIIEVHEYGVDEHGPYYTMELLSGQSLKTLAPLPWGRACALARDAASALAVLHSRRLVHRDVTPSNIQLARDGVAKLIDFGAMLPMGPARQVIGTPPFIAPECALMQVLDGRADIFALGATLYFALTGRHAYPARTVRDLQRVWKRRPQRLEELCPDVPAALDRLVLGMLSLEPAHRPRSIAEVFEHLTAIAGLPRSEDAEVAQAYLTNPELVGRGPELELLQRRVRRAARGRGRSLLVQGEAGTGRSRLLDAAVLEAKLRGLCVLRADAADAQDGPLGVARRLLSGLLEDRPELAARASVAEALAGLSGTAALLLEEHARERAIEAFCSCVLRASERHALALVVDDFDAIDEPSAACVASLAARIGRQPILLVASAPAQGAAPGSALSLLANLSQPLALAPLAEAQVRGFLASLFGDVPGLELMTQVALRTAGGNPRQLMDGAQALVAQRLARYAGGHWLISSDAAALETALAGASDLERLLAGLSADAVELLETLALDRDALMSLKDLPALTAHRDSGRVNRALTELVSAGALVAAENRFRFAREGLRERVARGMDEASRRARHERLAERCEALGAAPIYAAHHLMQAGLFARTVAPIDAFEEFIERFPGADVVRRPVVLETLEALLDAPRGTFAPAFRTSHGAGYVINAAYQGLPERALRYAPEMLEALSWFTGLSEHRALAGLEAGERLGRALALADERCKQTARPGFDVIKAIRRQSQVSIVTAVCARFMADPRVLDAIPDMTPYAPLSPALALAVRVVDALSKAARSQDFQAWDMLQATYADLRGAGDQLDPLTRVSLERAVLGYLCAYEVQYGTERALALIEEYAPAMPNLAESYRMRYHVSLGEHALADAARRRYEVLSVQANSLPEAHFVALPGYLTLYALASDLIGLTRTLDALEQVARTRPTWSTRVWLARAHVLRCRGEHGAALAVVAQAIARIAPGHIDFSALAALHVGLLDREGQHQRARELGVLYLEQAAAHGQHTFALELALAGAQAELGEHDAAEQRFARALAVLQARGARGLYLRNCLEVGARIANRRGDLELAAERARAGVEHAPLAHPSSVAPAPVDSAATDPSAMTASTATAFDATGTRDATQASFRMLLEGLRGEPDRYAAMLELLCRHAGAQDGALYLQRGTRLERVAITAGLRDTVGLDAEVAAMHASDIGGATDVTVALAEPGPREATLLRLSAATLVPYALVALQDGELAVTGMAVLDFADRSRAAVPHELLAALAGALAECGERDALADVKSGPSEMSASD